MKKILQNLSSLLLGIVFISSLTYAVEKNEAQLRKELPELLGSSNEGTEFFMTFHPCWETVGAADGCMIYITSAVATRVTVEIPGREIYIQRTTLPNDIIEIRLDPGIAQCYRKTDKEPPQPQRIFKGYGIIVTSDEPIICYGMVRYQNTSDGYLAIPKKHLGQNYMVSSYNDPCKDNGDQYLTSYTSIVGVFNKTTVKIRLGGRACNYTPGANPLKTGDYRVEKLDRGDVWLIGVMGDYNDLTGTTVEANKPVSVISGSFCAYVPIQMSSCDYLIEQDLPEETWGLKYHITPIINRRKAPIIRILASEPNTAIYRDGNEWALVPFVIGGDNSGFIERRTSNEGEALRPVTISAKSRIAVTQYNAGYSDDGIESDPFQMALIPIEQYQNKLNFCTPGIIGGKSFKSNYLNLCYKSTESGKIPDDIEFGKASNGVINWRKLNTVVGSSGQEIIDSSITDGRNYRVVTIPLEDPSGFYSIRDNETMMGYLYGFDNSDSYGFPVGGKFGVTLKPDVWAPKPIYTIDCYGHIEGRVIDQPENNENLRSNLEEAYLVKAESFNVSNFVYDESNFFPGETYVLDWSLAVIDVESDAKAVIAFSDRAGNDTTITIDYYLTKLTIKNRIENWGSKKITDPPVMKEFTLTNESRTPIRVDSIFLLSTEKDRKWVYNGFTIDSLIYKKYGGVLPGYTMQSGESLTFKVTFDPSSVKTDYEAGKGYFLDSIGVKANWSDDVKGYCYFKYKSAVKASMGKSCITVDRIDFGEEILGNSLSQVISITNNGNSDLNITGYTLSGGFGTGDIETNLGIIDAEHPLIIPEYSLKEFNVTFKPKTAGEFSGQIVFNSDADNACESYDPILELTAKGVEMTITPIPDKYLDENTSTNITFTLNSEDTSSVKIIKESSDEGLIPTDSIVIKRNGYNYIATITPVQNKTGTCFLTITATNNITSAERKFMVTVSKAGFVEDKTIDDNDITITPNPVKNNFSISSKTLIFEEVMIYDISGAVVLRTRNLKNINISNFAPGIYYCVVESNGKRYSKKLEIVK